MKTYTVVYFGAALIALLVTPIVSRIAKARGLVDKPSARKVHASAVPRVGGVGIMLGTFAMTAAVFLVNNVIADALREVRTQMIALVAGAALMFGVGLADDLRPVRSQVKLLCLVSASLAVCITGARFQSIGLGDWGEVNLGWLAWPITVLWIAGITVGMNFLDGLDGLAAGVAAIVTGSIALFAWFTGQTGMVVLMLALLGSLTGFLFLNFNPAKIFMGDCGSMFIGFTVAAGSVVCQAKTSTLVGLALPALALGVPILDTALTMIRRRVLDRRSVFVAERGHIHHRLLDRGLSQKAVVAVIYAITSVSAGLGVLMLTSRGGTRIALLAAGVLFLLIVFALAGSTRLRETLRAVKRHAATSRQIKEERSLFEDAQLRVRVAKSIDEWWQALCFMGERLDFARLALSLRNGHERQALLTWKRDGETAMGQQVVEVTIPIGQVAPGLVSQVEAAVGVNGSLEASGRRAALLGRLIDERRPPGDFRALAGVLGQSASGASRVVGAAVSAVRRPGSDLE